MCNHWFWKDHRTGKQAAIHPGMDWHIDKIIADMDRSGVDQIALMRESFIDQYCEQSLETHLDQIDDVSLNHKVLYHIHCKIFFEE